MNIQPRGCRSVPASAALGMAKGFSLYMVKAILSGRPDEVIDLAEI